MNTKIIARVATEVIQITPLPTVVAAIAVMNAKLRLPRLLGGVNVFCVYRFVDLLFQS